MPAVVEDPQHPLHAIAHLPLEMRLRRFFPIFCLLAILATFGYALYDAYQIDGDAVAYMDIGDLLRAHQWAGAVNGYWHPLYPACLSLGYLLFHATRFTELHAYYMVNFGIFLLEMLALVAFTDAIVRLRERLAPVTPAPVFVLGRYTLRYLGLGLLLIATQRELSLGKVRPDALLQTLILFALAALLRYFATGFLLYPALMGVALGLAYLTKSFAFLLALLCILALILFRRIWQRESLARIATAAALALLCFAALAGPYIAALSRQRGRFDFGDSGALNYAWYVGGTEKMHLEPYMTDRFGHATVHLKHPEKELLRSPQILSYRELPYGTYPDWFDPGFWNDQIKTHTALRGELSRGARNVVLVFRYLLNHPEPLLLLALLLVLGARPRLTWRPASHSESSVAANAFWLPPVALGLAMWGIYGIVNIEERYVTVAYFAVLLPLFATLHLPNAEPCHPERSEAESKDLHLATLHLPDTEPCHPERSEAESKDLHLAPPRLPLPTAYSLLPVFLALLAVGESTRTVLEDRRQLSGLKYPGGWYDPETFHAARALNALGVGPGDTIACIGDRACLHDHYWARLAGVRILTEIYVPPPGPPYQVLTTAPDLEQAIHIVRAQGDKLMVGYFEPSTVVPPPSNSLPFRELGDTNFYELPLNLGTAASGTVTAGRP